MSTPQSIKIMSVEVTALLPNSMEELLAVEGATEQKIFEAAKSKFLFHNYYGLLRDKVVAKLAAQGHHPKMSIKGKEVVLEKTTDGEGKVTSVYVFSETGKPVPEDKIDTIEEETNDVFFTRLCASQGVEKSSYAALFQEVVDENPFNLVTRVRVARSGEPKISKTFLKLSNDIFDRGVEAKVAEAVGAFLGETITFGEDKEENIATLALAIQRKEKQEAAQRTAAYTNLV